MNKDLFCVICGAKQDNQCDTDSLSGVCPHCGKNTIYVSDLLKWFALKNKDGEEDFFYIFTNNCDDFWVEIYEDNNKFHDLVNALVLQKDVKVIKKDKDVDFLQYKRKGHLFEIRYLWYGRFLIDPLWNGKPIIAFSFVRKDNPEYKIYMEEFLRIRSLLDELSLEGAEKPKCPKCISQNIQPHITTGNKKTRDNIVMVGAFVVAAIFTFIFAFLGGETNIFLLVLFSIACGVLISLTAKVIVNNIPMRKKIRFTCNDCGEEFAKSDLKAMMNQTSRSS